MFRKIRFRFIAIASLAILFILASFITVFYSARYVQGNGEIDFVLTVLSKNKGELPESTEVNREFGDRGVSEAVLNQYQYYSFITDENKIPISVNLKHIPQLTRQQLEDYMRNINLNEINGHFRRDGHSYSYRVTKISGSRHLVVVLDSTRYFDDRADLLNLALQMSFYSLLFFIIVVSVFSGFAIKPYIENYEKQKRFITNAGHELKTPLSIISANNELQELTTGETEWTKSTKEQVERLTHLINQLIVLARLEEQPDVVLDRVDFSAVAKEAAEGFKGLIIKDGKNFELQIASGIYVKAEEKSLFELVTLLVDNANKYCDAGGKISVSLSRTNGLKKAKLEVSNTYAEGSKLDYSRFFDRFYREDESHNTQTTGYGIGLSMAESIVKIFKGKISVSYKNDTITFKVTL
ncbi:sensor histidine kinase [Streptococcus devriesei]|uniref:sensor histidine kinase n=1 Tax=Streptococcus devriesei TaxID=231233 RepID=UPI000410C791|nr:HAMP domain-containing sensor histidine kinase [Streptococcus devriesei]